LATIAGKHDTVDVDRVLGQCADGQENSNRSRRYFRAGNTLDAHK